MRGPFGQMGPPQKAAYFGVTEEEFAATQTVRIRGRGETKEATARV